MNRLFKVLCLSLMLFSLAFFVNAQEATDETEEPKVETTYDQSRDETQVEVARMPISVSRAKKALFNVSASFSGRKIKSKPDDVIFIVQIVSEGGYKYPQINRVTLNSNGKNLGEILLLNLDQRKFSDNEFLESIGTRIKFELFKKMTTAKKITFQIGESNFQIDEPELAKLVEFEKVINP